MTQAASPLILWRFCPFHGNGVPDFCWGFEAIKFLRGADGSLTPNPQPGGPLYVFLLGTSLETCSARVVLSVAWLPPTYAASLALPKGENHRKCPCQWHTLIQILLTDSGSPLCRDKRSPVRDATIKLLSCRRQLEWGRLWRLQLHFLF
jgi:hypothetical protein